MAVESGISREHLNRLESGKVALTDEVKTNLLQALERYNPDVQLTMLFDYVRICFPTSNVKHVIEDILKLKAGFMIHEDFGFYSYTEHYYIDRKSVV